jgi:hypothetical protein
MKGDILMSNISTEHKEKLQKLIYSDEFENVVMGLNLLDTLIEDENDIYEVFDLTYTVPPFIEQWNKRIADPKLSKKLKLLY